MKTVNRKGIYYYLKGASRYERIPVTRRRELPSFASGNPLGFGSGRGSMHNQQRRCFWTSDTKQYRGLSKS